MQHKCIKGKEMQFLIFYCPIVLKFDQIVVKNYIMTLTWLMLQKIKVMNDHFGYLLCF